MENYIKYIKNNLWAQVLISMAMGILLGFFLSKDISLIDAKTSTIVSNWLALPGVLFLKLIQMIMIPLSVTSVMYGIGSMKSEDLKSTGLGVALYFFLTTVIAVCIGLLVSSLLSPTKVVASALDMPVISSKSSSVDYVTNPSVIIDFLIPSNPFAALATGDILPLVLFSIIMGLALTSIKESESAQVLQLLQTIQHLVLKITQWVMKISPIAVFGLVVQIIAKSGIGLMLSLGGYIGVVVLGLFIHSIVYFLIVQVWAKTKFSVFLSNIKEAILMSFSMASSGAVMPLTMKIAEEKLKAHPSIVKFVIPVGATLSMDGTALYQTVAAVFISKLYGFDLTLPQTIMLAFTTIFASIGTPAAPGAGIMILGNILSSVGIPIQGISLILGVDRLLGMFRAGINVVGDLSGVVLFDYFYKKRNETKF